MKNEKKKSWWMRWIEVTFTVYAVGKFAWQSIYLGGIYISSEIENKVSYTR